MELESRRPAGTVYRLARRPNAWQPPEWSFAHGDGTFGNRFDDPDGYYRVLYASSQRLACFVETLARFRADLSLLAELEEIDGNNDFTPLGVLPRQWIGERVMGDAELSGIYADIYAVSWVSHLRFSLASEASRLGVQDIDLSILERVEPRRLTQLASREIYALNFTGVFYHSRYGHSLENWLSSSLFRSKTRNPRISGTTIQIYYKLFDFTAFEWPNEAEADISRVRDNRSSPTSPNRAMRRPRMNRTPEIDRDHLR